MGWSKSSGWNLEVLIEGEWGWIYVFASWTSQVVDVRKSWDGRSLRGDGTNEGERARQ